MCGDPLHRSSQTRDPAHGSHAARLTFFNEIFSTGHFTHRDPILLTRPEKKWRHFTTITEKYIESVPGKLCSRGASDWLSPSGAVRGLPAEPGAS